MAINEETIRALEALEIEEIDDADGMDLRETTICWGREWCWKTRYGG
jgi:hypothetical protein